MRKLLPLVVAIVVLSGILIGCQATKTSMTTDEQVSTAPATPEPPPTPDVEEVTNDLFVHPPYRNMSKTYYASAGELADELREKLSFGICFADDKMTDVAKWNVGLIDNQSRAWNMPNWPHKVRLEGHGDVFVFRARGYNADGYLHWKCADDGLDLDFPCLAGGVTRIRTQYLPEHHDYGWYYDELGHFCDYDYEGVETTYVILKKKAPGGETILKRLAREESWTWKPPWGADEDGHDCNFLMPATFWATARKVPLPHGSTRSLDIGGSTVERTPDGAEYRYIRMGANEVSSLGIEPGKIVKLSDGRRARVESVTLDRNPDSRIVKVKVLAEDQAKTAA